MARKCSVCAHENRKDIDLAIIAGDSYRGISRRYGLSSDAVERHVKSGHISAKMQKAREYRDFKDALSFDDYVNELNEKDRAAFLESHISGTPKEKAEATKTRINTLTLLGKKLGELVDKKEITGADGSPFTINLVARSFKKPEPDD